MVLLRLLFQAFSSDWNAPYLLFLLLSHHLFVDPAQIYNRRILSSFALLLHLCTVHPLYPIVFSLPKMLYIACSVSAFLLTHILLQSWGSFIFILFLLWLWWALNWLPLSIQLVKVSLLLLLFLSFKVKVKSLSHVQLFETPWTVAHQASPSMGFSRQEYWSGLLFPSLGIFPTQGSNLGLPHCGQTLYHLSHQGSPLSKPVSFILEDVYRNECYFER